MDAATRFWEWSERVSLSRHTAWSQFAHNRNYMLTLDTLRAGRREEILRIARRRGACSVRVFGSIARGDAGPESDLDLLVAWEPGRSLLDYAGPVQDLQELLGMKGPHRD